MVTAREIKPTISGRNSNHPSQGIHAMLSRLGCIIRRLAETDCDTPDNRRDPLSHPAIRAMSARELADLPFPSRMQKP